MIKFRHLLFIAILSVIVYACGNETETRTPFDHAGQALKDKDTILKFLANHYYDTTIDSIKPLVAGKTPLVDDNRLKKMDVKEGDIDFTMYYIVQKQGNPVPVKEVPFPTVVDSILATYHLDYFTNSKDVVSFQNTEVGRWYDSRQIAVRGWVYGFTKLKGGENVSQVGEPLQYINGGEGIFIIPSGLAYQNSSRVGAQNANLIYYVNLWDHSVNTDHDLDNISSMREDLDGDGDPRNDDTDKDGLANYLDNDDDNDRKLTKDEDANGDGDPTNDKNDPNKPNVPDYLNPDV